MLISIVIPCYNAEKYLNECLSSIKRQSYTKWEAICIDDGSSDNTKKILDKYSKDDERFIIESQTNQGVSVARNNALKKCSGKYICFVDSDDIVEPDFLETLIKTMKDNIDLSICNFTRKMTPVDKKQKRATISWEKFGYECAEKIILDKTFNPQLWCMMFKKDIIEKYNINFYPNCTRGEDWEFFMKYIAHTKQVVYSDHVIYHYRKSETSAMASLNIKSLTSIDASQRVSDYYVYNNNKSRNIIKQYSVSRTIWKFTILALMNHNMELYRIIKNKYDINKEMHNMYSYPGILEKATSRLFNFSELFFKGCFYLSGFIYQHK